MNLRKNLFPFNGEISEDGIEPVSVPVDMSPMRITAALPSVSEKVMAYGLTSKLMIVKTGSNLEVI